MEILYGCPDPKCKRYRFGLIRLFVLCTVIALTLTLVRRLPILAAGQVAAGIYFSLLWTWVIMRWPAVYASLRELRARRRALLESRRQMAAEAEQARNHSGSVAQTDSER